MPWIRNEDAALKAKIQGLNVFDGNAPAPVGRPVPVRYKLPEDELANLSYPILIIEHVGMYPDPEREHRAGPMYQIPYAPEGYAPWWNADAEPETADPSQSPYFGYFPIPYNFDYKITLYARFMNTHAQPLVAQLLQEQYLPYHMGYLQVPQDRTTRSMFLMGGPTWNYAKDEDDKRIIQVTFMIRVFSELVVVNQSLESFGGTLVPVNSVDIDLSVYSDVQDIDLTTPQGIQENSAAAVADWTIQGVRLASQFNADVLP